MGYGEKIIKTQISDQNVEIFGPADQQSFPVVKPRIVQFWDYITALDGSWNLNTSQNIYISYFRFFSGLFRAGIEVWQTGNLILTGGDFWDWGNTGW